MLDSVNTWCYTGNVPPANIPDTFYNGNCDYLFLHQSAHHIYTIGDTLVNTIKYKILESVNTSANTCRYGYIREDTTSKKIYFMDNQLNPEFLLFDFGMQIGDSLILTFASSSVGSYYDNGFYKLDSIIPFNLSTGSTYAYYLSCTFCNSVMEWIEGIGHRGSLAYPLTDNSFGIVFSICGFNEFPYSYHQLLTSFQHAERIYFDSCALQYALANPIDFTYYDTCIYDYIGSGIGEFNQSSIILYPNPASENIICKSNYNLSSVQLHILDLPGNLITSKQELFIGKEEPFSIDVAILDPGLYLLQFASSEFIITKKMLIE